MLSPRIKERLRQKPPIRTDETRVAATVTLARQAYGMRPREKSLGFLAFCLRQVGFCGWQTWLLQGALLLCMGIFMRAMGLMDIRLFTDSAAFALRALAILSALTALPTLYRSSRYRMLETEIATRAGYARLLLSRLALVAIGDALLLLGALAFAALTTDMGVVRALYCVLPPYLIMLAALLTLLMRIPLSALPYALLALGALMLIAAAAYNALMPPCVATLPHWRALCALLLLQCVTQLVRLKKQGGFADVQFSA